MWLRACLAESKSWHILRVSCSSAQLSMKMRIGLNSFTVVFFPLSAPPVISGQSPCNLIGFGLFHLLMYSSFECLCMLHGPHTVDVVNLPLSIVIGITKQNNNNKKSCVCAFFRLDLLEKWRNNNLIGFNRLFNCRIRAIFKINSISITRAIKALIQIALATFFFFSCNFIYSWFGERIKCI